MSYAPDERLPDARGMQGRERLRRDASGTASNDDDEGHDDG
jgi:hypothetical protein